MSRNLHFVRIYPHPPTRVWQALTDPKALTEWLMENDFEPIVGHRFCFRTKPMPGFDGVVRCEVVEIDAPRRLVYTWQGGGMRQSTLVTWTLEEIAEGTRLRLEHTGFEGLGGLTASFILGLGWPRLLRWALPRTLAALDAEMRNGVARSVAPH